jgi:hypothetical protein
MPGGCEWHPARIGVKPIPGQDLSLLADQPGLCITLAHERPRSRPVNTIRPLVPDLPSARWQAADSAETTTISHLCDPPPTATRPRDWLHNALRNEFRDSRFRDADMAAHMNEPDAAFSDETTRKPRLCAQQLGDLGHAQEPFHPNRRSPGHHAALPLAETSAARASCARRLASARAFSQRSRSPTERRSRLPGGR